MRVKLIALKYTDGGNVAGKCLFRAHGQQNWIEPNENFVYKFSAMLPTPSVHKLQLSLWAV